MRTELRKAFQQAAFAVNVPTEITLRLLEKPIWRNTIMANGERSAATSFLMSNWGEEWRNQHPELSAALDRKQEMFEDLLDRNPEEEITKYIDKDVQYVDAEEGGVPFEELEKKMELYVTQQAIAYLGENNKHIPEILRFEERRLSK